MGEWDMGKGRKNRKAKKKIKKLKKKLKWYKNRLIGTILSDNMREKINGRQY